MTVNPQRTYTVVICTYNRRDYVVECVASVLEQTRRPDEIIVVDDGSSDGTACELRRLFPQVIVVEQENRGRSIAANRAVAMASCEWICLLDDDDIWHQDKLRQVDEYLAKTSDCRALNHPVWFFQDRAGPKRTPFGFDVDFIARNSTECHAAANSADSLKNDPSYLFIRGKSYECLLVKNAGVYSGTVIRRDVMITAGGLPPGLTYADDWTFFLNVARIAEWHTIPEKLGFTRIHTQQSTGAAGNARTILAANLSVWFGGRAFPEHKSVEDLEVALKGYQEVYVQLVHHLLWSSLRRSQWRVARDVRRLGRPLIQRRRDWLYIQSPSPLTTRLSRMREFKLRSAG